ncbi:hypothetical protein HPB52_015460 [Rhipicephalus sanguineus]|uniref:Uncharacterized protein n=1 Tax=Rhipicephalus sanguineus TaxID=34632 RepID=A0A9D4PRX0_RHISA|nr:hypothetical protein HPB52_015460 [Rhipicephalus sanguineus]
MPSRECLEEVLNVTELCGISVSGDPVDDELLQYIESGVLVVSATRNGNTVTRRFAGPTLPKHARLRQSHPSTESCSARARPVNSGHGRPANNPACRKWQDEREVATIRASSMVPHSRLAVRAMAQKENPSQFSGPPASAATRTFAQAAFSAPRPVPAPVHQQVASCSVLPGPAPTVSPVAPAVKLSVEPVPKLRDDPRDAIIASLQLTLRAIGELLPSDSLLKAMCRQAGSLQNTSSHHG